MQQDGDRVRMGGAMLAGMTPVLREGVFHFCVSADADVVAAAVPACLAFFREDEGATLVLDEATAAALGFDRSMPMRRIVLEVFSALDGVGLTAGVSGALAQAGIPCNMVAAYHHDHVFVPAAMAERALGVLLAVQRGAGGFGGGGGGEGGA